MPEQHYKPKSRYAPQFMLSDATRQGMLVKLRCTLCRRTVYYLAADLVAVYGDMPFYDFRLPCSKDGTDESIQIDYRSPQVGDYRSLNVRRPGPVRRIQTWRTVKLGDEI